MNEPKLSVDGQKEFESYIESAKESLKRVSENVLNEIYINLSDWIESDSWINFRNMAFDYLRDYQKLNKYEAEKIRKSIYENNKEQIDKDLNQDLLDRIKELENLVSFYKDNTWR